MKILKLGFDVLVDNIYKVVVDDVDGVGAQACGKGQLMYYGPQTNMRHNLRGTWVLLRHVCLHMKLGLSSTPIICNHITITPRTCNNIAITRGMKNF